MNNICKPNVTQDSVATISEGLCKQEASRDIFVRLYFSDSEMVFSMN